MLLNNSQISMNSNSSFFTSQLYVLRMLQFFIFVFQIFWIIVVYILCSALQRMTRNTLAHFVISNLFCTGYELTQRYWSDTDPWH